MRTRLPAPAPTTCRLCSLLLLLASCRDKDSGVPTPDSEGEDPQPVVSAEPWTRGEEASPGSVTFTELLYHHPTDPDLEWVELHNPMSFDLDLSGWSLEGDVAFTFAEGTVLEAGAYRVVAADPARVDAEALGPYTGRLSDSGPQVTLVSNGGRRMDSLQATDDEPWPAAADGSGLSLAKRRATAASDRAEGWTVSATLGGTPGQPNGVDPLAPPTELELLPLDTDWRYAAGSAATEPGWAEPGFDDSGWASGEAPFYAGEPYPSVDATVWVTADNYYAVYLGQADGTDLALVAEDPDGDWTSVEGHEVTLGPRDHLYLAAWEAPWDYGGPQMVIAEVELPEGRVGTSAAGFEWALAAAGACPGTAPADPAPPIAELDALVAAGAWAAPAVEATRGSDPWGWAVSSAFDDATRYIWVDTFADTSVTNTSNTYAVFRSVEPVLGEAGQTELDAGVPTTTFRTDFVLNADPGATVLLAECVLDDGAIFFLNGVEVARENMPAGAVDAQTLASTPVEDPSPVVLTLPTTPLVRGQNTLVVEVHQAEPDDADLLFGCALSARVQAQEATPSVLLHELGAGGEAWVELVDASGLGQDTTGLVLRTAAGEEQVLPAGQLTPGGLGVVEGLPLVAGELVFLYNAAEDTLLDAVRVGGRPRARAEGPGPWRTPTEATPGEPNRIDTVDDIVITELMYHHAPRIVDGEVVEQDEEWIELTNRGDEAVDLSGWQLVDAVAWEFAAGTVLEPGATLVVSNGAAALRDLHPGVEIIGDFRGSLRNSGDRVLLLDALGNPADEVRYADGGRWPEAADGGGSSLELLDPWADNTVAEAWAASDESARSAWVDVELLGTAEPSAVGPDGVWEELVLGLLDAGEVLIDDLSVVQDPDTEPVEVLQNGSFEDTEAWRLLGTHRHSEVVPDPDDPSNSVLRLVATGPTEHMHNHAETTLTRAIGTRDYRISFRARWVWGTGQLHTRLYFNRMPRTTRLEPPALAGTPGAPSSHGLRNLGPTMEGLRAGVVVPAPGETVPIQVQATDPDGVAGLTLWTSVDGGVFAATAMTEQDGTWTGEVAGQPAGSIVQFYVEAEDSRGATAMFPAGGPDSRALLQFDPGEEVPAGLHSLRILLTAADSDWLHDEPNLMSNDPIGATVIYDDAEVYYNVGLRTKGSQRGRPETVRLGYAVRFGRDEPFRGSHTSVLIDRSEGVQFGQRELLINLVMMRAGIVSAEYNDLIYAITPRPEHTGSAELQLDRSTNLVLAAQFEDGDEGMLYDYELIYYPYTTEDGTAEGLKLPQPDAVVGTPITDLGLNREDYRWNFTLQNNTEQDDYSGIMALGRAFSHRGTDRFLEEASAIIDTDQWLRSLALASLAGAVDNYGGDYAQHNARFYVRPDDGRVLYFPHDLDYFGGYTGAVVGNTDLYYLLQDPVLLRTWYQHLEDLLEGPYSRDYLEPWCTQLGTLLPAQDFESHCQFIQNRADWVSFGAADSIAQRFPPLDFAITTNEGLDFETAQAQLTLEGEGWIDVREVWLEGQVLELTWLDERTWQVELALEPGDNTVVLEAVNLAGDVVGLDTITITREGR